MTRGLGWPEVLWDVMLEQLARRQRLVEQVAMGRGRCRRSQCPFNCSNGERRGSGNSEVPILHLAITGHDENHR